MKRTLLFLPLGAAALLVRAIGQPTPPADQPRFTADGQLQRPDNYREWIWLSSGLGMSYGPIADQMRRDQPPFDNVFVTPSAYRAFRETGTWPDKTMFVLELRKSMTKGSINQEGRFQGELAAVEVEVKDESRFPGKWAFFGFPTGAAAARQIPATAACYQCHPKNGAVDNTFVQFYPTLIDIAKAKGTFRETPETK